MNGSIAMGSRRTTPTLPVAAAVVSEAIVAPRKTPCCQLKLSQIKGTVPARREPKKIALKGTPCGSSQCGAIEGHCPVGAVKRALGWAAFSLEPGVQSCPIQ